MTTVTVGPSEVPVRTQTDVLVCGGGLGGVAAAVAAARTGAQTMLIERNSYPGGVATAGMCCSIFN
ncbi:MAG: FAD-dependent oxidoreductase, partial [Armatimonadota bacterium]